MMGCSCLLLKVGSRDQLGNGGWRICRKTSLILWGSSVSSLSTVSLLLTSVFPSLSAAFPSLVLLQGLTLTAGSQLSALGQAFASTGSCSWLWPQMLLRLLFKTWAVFHLCSSTGAAPEKVAVLETMAYSFLSIFPIVVQCYASFSSTGKVQCFKVGSEASQKAQQIK